MNVDKLALSTVDAIFADIRRRGLLKRLFDPRGTENLIGNFDDGEKLHGIELDVQGRIKTAWQVNIADALTRFYGTTISGSSAPLLVLPSSSDCEYCVDGLQADGETPCPFRGDQTPARAAKEWRCFHCDEIFSDEHSAKLHHDQYQFFEKADVDHLQESGCSKAETPPILEV